MIKLLFLFIGAGIGSLGGFEFALIGAVLGVLIGGLIGLNDRDIARERSLEKLQHQVNTLEQTVAELRQRPPVAAPEVIATAAVSSAAPRQAEGAAPREAVLVAEPPLTWDIAAAETANAGSETTTEDATSPPPIELPRVEPVARAAGAMAPTPSTGEARHPPDRAPARPVRPMQPNPLVKAWRWLFGGNALVRVGVVVLFFGVAFLIKFAAERTTVPVELRYAGIVAGAMLALFGGWRFRLRRPGYAMALQGLAVATLYLTLFAGYRLHHLIPGGMCATLLVLTCVFSAALAVLQNARSLAVIGICGGFLAPVLASSGGGSHVALFGYFALLNAGIFGIAWFKAWRSLNVLGFLFTFGIGSLWAQGNYRDDLFASTEPFLILFFLFYLAIAVMYGQRRLQELSPRASISVGGERVDYVDGTLVFGVPLAAFSLQYLMVRPMEFGAAFSALGLGLIYLPLAAWLYKKRGDDFRLLVESFLALGAIFASLAIPLALDALWTSAAWAAEGAGIFWVCCRQQRPVGRAFALLLQFGAGLNFMSTLDVPGTTALFGLQAVIDGPALGALLVGSAGLLTARNARHYALSGPSAIIEALACCWGLAFLGLMPLLLLNLAWSACVWAALGTAALRLGLRVKLRVARVAGILLQVLAGITFALNSAASTSLRPVLNPFWLGALVLVICAFLSGLWLHRSGRTRQAWYALIWSLTAWTLAGALEIDAHSTSAHVIALLLALASASALGLLWLRRVTQWPALALAAVLLLPGLVIIAAMAWLSQTHPAAAYGWLAWPAALMTAGWVLSRQDPRSQPEPVQFAHVVWIWLLAALGVWEGVWCFDQVGASGSAWPALGWVLVPLSLLALNARPALARLWPLRMHAELYSYAALPLALGSMLWLLVANVAYDGNATPLPYLPLLNPLDLAIGMTVLVVLRWARYAAPHLQIAMLSSRRVQAGGLGLLGFYWFNGMLLRSLHHWAEIPYRAEALLRSTLVQASLSISWALIGMLLMLTATRRQERALWMTGGALMAVVVVKLFVIDLSRVGTVERIVSFMGVGLLLLLLGYFSPAPPKRATTP